MNKHSLELPKRQTKYSAGYDFKSPVDCVIHPGEVVKIPTGIKIRMNEDEMMMLVVRSSTGFKYNVRMTNQVGIFVSPESNEIKSDFYNNETNEGHAMVSLQNEGKEDFVIHKGDRIVQGIFVKFLTVDEEEEITTVRRGSIGSTNKEEKK